MLATNGATNEDIILVAAASSIIFQLRPSVLLRRFHDLNRAAAKHTGFAQKVVFGASARCSGYEESDSMCYAQILGASSPKGVYPVLEMRGGRPQYLDSGFMIGSVGAIREVFERAQELRGDTVQSNSDSDTRAPFGVNTEAHPDAAVLSKLFALQQYARSLQQARAQKTKWWRFIVPTPLPDPSAEAAAADTNLAPSTFNDTAHELGIGLDYLSSLVHVHDVASHLASDTRFIRYSGKRPRVPRRGVSGCTPRLKKQPREILSSPAPFNGLRAKDQARDTSTNPLPAKSWKDVDLFTNICTGEIPAAILYQDHSVDDGDFRSVRREHEWTSFWHYAYLQRFLHLQTPGKEQGYISAKQDFEKESIGDIDAGRAVRWNEMCGALEQDVVGDGMTMRSLQG